MGSQTIHDYSMITPDNMLNAVAAHLLSRQSKRIHITDRQLWAARETQTTLESWAASKGLAVSCGECGGWPGFWLSLDPSRTSA